MKSRFFQRSGLLVLLVFGLVACQDDELDLGDMPNSIFGEGSGDVYQAEDNSAKSGCNETTNHAGYTGSGFMDYGGDGTWIEWNDVDVAAAGDYDLTFRYANARTSGRQSAAFVNGQNIGNVAFGGTGSWTTWGTDTITVSLREGLNTIRIQANTGRGGPNLDAMEVTVNDLCLDDPNKTEPGQCGCGVPEGSCGGETALYEAEDRTAESGCRHASNHIGFTGSGFMDYGGNGTWIEWNNVSAAQAGDHLLTFRYANGGATRQSAAIVGGQDKGNITFANTGGWTKWGTDTITVSLKAGNNTIRIMANTGSGGPNLDSMEVKSVGGPIDNCPDDPNKTEPGQCGCGVPEGTCTTTSACDEAPERGSVALTCQAGETITKIDFASYGLPTGSCAAGFAAGTCHAASSKSKVEEACLNQQSCSVAASNGVFGDPCVGKHKKLAVVYTCGSGGDPLLPVKVFILAGQSNMVGAGTVTATQSHLDKNGGLGTLTYLVENSPSTFGHLVTPSGAWAARDDVQLVDLNGSGSLTVTGDTFGPELQFGQVMGDLYDNPVVIIKIAWGGKSLAVDFRPPSSGGDVGPYYTTMVERVHEVLDNMDQFLPGYNDQGYEIAGFGWHQGWNDRINQAFNDAYQTNCVNLINDLRDEFGAAEMPFVLATTGMNGWDETHPRALSLMEAQLAVPDDARLDAGKVAAVETRDFWRDESESPANQGYHWNRNAETYFLIGDSMAEAMIDFLPNETIGTIDKVYFAQTHVLSADDPYFRLVSDREALIKVHVIADELVNAPDVTALLKLKGKTLKLNLEGPDMLPMAFISELGQVDHNYEDSFTAFIPEDWVQPGLSVTIQSASDRREIAGLNVGAPTRVLMTMFDVHYFKYSPGDYAAGWQEELEAKWPVSKLELRRIPSIVFEELVIPPRANVPAARVVSKDDYKVQTGLNFDGEQAAALQWKGALQAAAGTRLRTSLYYVNIYGAWAGGQAGNFGGVGNGTSYGILHHELGHALSLPDNCTVESYPYRGDMHGIPAGEQIAHVGPTWAFDLPSGTFITPVVQEGASRGIPGTYKADPMCGGGMGGQNNGFLYRYFSDYHMNKIQKFLEGNVVVWNQSLGSYSRWDDATSDYTKAQSNNGVQYPVTHDASVISVMAAVSGAKPDVCMVYPPIGPYQTGLIKLFDPRNAAQRQEADSIYCPSSGCDVSLRITQGGAQKIYLLPATWDTAADPLNRGSLITKAVNLPASAGAVTKVELLLTPDAEKNGLPGNPTVLDVWN